MGNQKIHGRFTQVLLGGVNLSTNTTDSQVELSSESHDITTYGKNSHVFQGGLLNGNATLSGIYDKSVLDGPRAAVRPLIGTNVQLIHRPEGTGAGLPQDIVTVLVTKYTQTSPVADMVKWAVDLQFSDDVNYANQ